VATDRPQIGTIIGPIARSRSSGYFRRADCFVSLESDRGFSRAIFRVRSYVYLTHDVTYIRYITIRGRYRLRAESSALSAIEVSGFDSRRRRLSSAAISASSRIPLLDQHDRSIAPLPPSAAFQSRSRSWIARFRRNDVTDLQHARATRAPGVTQGVRSTCPEISVRTVKTFNIQQRPGRSKIGQSAGQTTPRGELAVRWRAAASGDPTRLRIGCNHVRACVYPVFPLLGIREGISFARCRSPLHQREQYSSLPTPRVVQITIRETEPLSGIPMNSMNNRDRSSRTSRHATCPWTSLLEIWFSERCCCCIIFRIFPFSFRESRRLTSIDHRSQTRRRRPPVLKWWVTRIDINDIVINVHKLAQTRATGTRDIIAIIVSRYKSNR